MIAYITAIDNNGFRGYSAYSFIHVKAGFNLTHLAG